MHLCLRPSRILGGSVRRAPSFWGLQVGAAVEQQQPSILCGEELWGMPFRKSKYKVPTTSSSLFWSTSLCMAILQYQSMLRWHSLVPPHVAASELQHLQGDLLPSSTAKWLGSGGAQSSTSAPPGAALL